MVRAASLALLPSLSLACAMSTAAPPETSSDVQVEAKYDGPPKTVLVELFSSQGCNSCPAADALVGRFPEMGWDETAVVPLTFHVTYWDDLGWADPYADSLHDQRQIGYATRVSSARAEDEGTIVGPYTPQMVVDGRVHFSGALEAEARKQIERNRNRPTPIVLEASARVADGNVQLDVTSRAASGASFDTDRSKIGLFAALAQTHLETQVPRGENAGTTLDESWVVRDFEGPKLFRSAKAHNETRFELALPDGVDAGQMRAVVFAQDLASLEVYAVTALELAGSAESD